MFYLASQYGFVFVAQFFQTRGAMRMKAEEAEDLLSRVKPGQVTVGILPYYAESLCLLIDTVNIVT